MSSFVRLLSLSIASFLVVNAQPGKLTPIDSQPKAPQNAVTQALQAQIIYHGGPVMLGPVKVYYIYYGNWTGATEVGSRAILDTFAGSIGGSPYHSINTTYTDGGANHVSNVVNFQPPVFDNPPSQGMVVGPVGAINIVKHAFSALALPVDPTAVYFVLTAPDVQENSGFCGYHDSFQNGVGGPIIKYAVVPNKKNQVLTFCAAQTISSPNNNPAADAMANVSPMSWRKQSLIRS